MQALAILKSNSGLCHNAVILTSSQFDIKSQNGRYNDFFKSNEQLGEQVGQSAEIGSWVVAAKDLT